MNIKSKVNYFALLRLILYTLAITAGIYLAFKASVYLAPFIIAFIISTVLEPVIAFLVTKARMSRKVSATVTLLIVIIVIGTLLALLISKLISEAVSISNLLPYYYSKFYENIQSLLERANKVYVGLPLEVTKNIENIFSNLTGTLVGFANTFIKGALNTAISIPSAIIFTLVTILSTFFLMSDRDRIYGYFKSQLPESWFDKASSIKTDMFSALLGYIRAQLILMTITFSELCIGFWITGIDYFVLLAFIIAIIDALPILGTGGVLIPWSIYELLTGNIRLGVSLIIIYGVVLVVRQMIEPKVLGQQIGIHPLLTLLAMYTGLQLFGVFGLIIGPISLLLIKNILQGILKNSSLIDYVKSNIFYKPGEDKQ